MTECDQISDNRISLETIKKQHEANKMNNWRRKKLVFVAKLQNLLGKLIFKWDALGSKQGPYVLFIMGLIGFYPRAFYLYLGKLREKLRPKPFKFNGQVQDVQIVFDNETDWKKAREKAEKAEALLFDKLQDDVQAALTYARDSQAAKDALDKEIDDMGAKEANNFYKPLKAYNLPVRPFNCATPVETDVTGNVLGKSSAEDFLSMEEFLSDDDFEEIKPRKKAPKKTVKVKKSVKAKKVIKAKTRTKSK